MLGGLSIFLALRIKQLDGAKEFAKSILLIIYCQKIIKNIKLKYSKNYEQRKKSKRRKAKFR
jgi:hypothetical protein